MDYEVYMQRCVELAKLGAGNVAPNPMVGAVLVYEGRIIGEGYHQKYGEAHAEVNCIASVGEQDKIFISQSTLYVSLEPCAHFGKTPPCADLIIQHKIPHVVIGCRDPFAAVNGKGIDKLNAAGIQVETGILENECKELNKRFFTFHEQQRPYIILKWAQTANGKIAGPNLSKEDTLDSSKDTESFKQPGSEVPPCGGFRGDSRLLISNEFSNRLVHKWRSEEAAILVGTNTALLDDPELTNRLWSGHSPVRFVLDMNLRLPSSLKIFDQQQPTIVFNKIKQEENKNLVYYQLTDNENIIHQIAAALCQLQIQSVLIEGGARLLQSFIDTGLWDEARVITNTQLKRTDGLAAPVLPKKIKVREEKLLFDLIETFKPIIH